MGGARCGSSVAVRTPSGFQGGALICGYGAAGCQASVAVGAARRAVPAG